jgi:glyoxylase-like metal-dependent hydrolase (beta-lactamase superfamily II)
MTEIKYASLGSIGTNCYIVKNTALGEGFMIDTADDYDGAVSFIEKCGVTLKAILLTHGHYDHMTAAVMLAKRYKVDIYASEHEKNTLSNPNVNLSAQMGRESVSMSADCLLSDGEELEIAGIRIKAIYTPGHTEGGMSYYVMTDGGLKDGGAQGVLFSGDTLFAESVGRTDFPGGSMSSIVASVREKLFKLPDDTPVFPGHGSETSIGHEKMYNPFCMD